MSQAFDFPTTGRLTNEVLRRDFLAVDDKRSPNKNLHFATVLPKTWRPMDLPAGVPAHDASPVRLALYHPDDGSDTWIEVAVVSLEREVDPADWLDQFHESLGLMRVAGRDQDTDAGRCPDRLTISLDPGNPQVARWMVRKNGPHLFIVQCRATMDDYSATADAFFLAVTAFKLLNPIRWPLAESLATFSRHDPGNFLLMVPESWQRKSDPPNHPTFLETRIVNAIGGASVGQLTFATTVRTTRTTPAKLLEDYLWGLSGTGIRAKPPKLEKGQSLNGVPETWTTTFPASGPFGPIEARLLLGFRAEWCYVFSLLGPPRVEMPSVWAINKRAFEIALNYFVAEPRGGRSTTN